MLMWDDELRNLPDEVPKRKRRTKESALRLLEDVLNGYSVGCRGDDRSKRRRVAVDQTGVVSMVTRWTAGKIQTVSLASLALADYHSTQRGLARGGREVGPVLSCGEQLCGGRYLGLNVGVVAGMYFVTRYAVPKLPPRWRKATNIMINTMVIGRGAVVVSNYQKAASLRR